MIVCFGDKFVMRWTRARIHTIVTTQKKYTIRLQYYEFYNLMVSQTYTHTRPNCNDILPMIFSRFQCVCLGQKKSIEIREYTLHLWEWEREWEWVLNFNRNRLHARSSLSLSTLVQMDSCWFWWCCCTVSLPSFVFRIVVVLDKFFYAQCSFVFPIENVAHVFCVYFFISHIHIE